MGDQVSHSCETGTGVQPLGPIFKGQRRVVIVDVSGQPVGPILTLEDGTDRFSRNVGNSAHLRCITSQKSEDLVQV